MLIGRITDMDSLEKYMWNHGRYFYSIVYNNKSRGESLKEGSLLFENEDMLIRVNFDKLKNFALIRVTEMQIEEYLSPIEDRTRLSRREIEDMVLELEEEYPDGEFKITYDRRDKMYIITSNLDTFNDNEFNEWMGRKMLKCYNSRRSFNVCFR